MLLKLCFGKPRTKDEVSFDETEPEVPQATVKVLDKTGESLEAKQIKLTKQIADETENALKFKREKNKRAAILTLKKVKRLQQQLDQFANLQGRVNEQGILLETASTTATTVIALKAGADALKSIQRITSLTDVEKTMEEINEQADTLRQMEEAISAPIAALDDLDDDELMAELDELEEEEQEVAHAVPVRVPRKKKPVRENAPETANPVRTGVKVPVQC